MVKFVDVALIGALDIENLNADSITGYQMSLDGKKHTFTIEESKLKTEGVTLPYGYHANSISIFPNNKTTHELTSRQSKTSYAISGLVADEFNERIVPIRKNEFLYTNTKIDLAPYDPITGLTGVEKQAMIVVCPSNVAVAHGTAYAPTTTQSQGAGGTAYGSTVQSPAVLASTVGSTYGSAAGYTFAAVEPAATVRF